MANDLGGAPRKRPTIYDVAHLAGVSTYTVSSVLNRTANVSPELTQRVRDAVRELDYTPNAIARSLPLRKTKTIGLLIPDIANPFYAKVIRGVEDRLSVEGYSVILGGTYNRAEEQSRYVNLFRAHQVDGLLMFAAGGDDEARSFMEEQGPVVFLGREPSYPADIVTGDNRETLQLAVDYLAGNGHSRIAILCGPLTLSTNAQRVEGWRIAMHANRLDTPAHLIGVGDWTSQSGYALARTMLASAERPTAIFAGNFLMLTGVLRAIQERGLACPADVEVLSADDSDWFDVFSPPITTVVTSSYEMGANGAELLLKRIRQKSRKFQRVMLKPELRVRR